MDHQEMVDQVSDELRNTKIQAKITRWLNMAIRNVATNYVFGHLHSYGTKNTAAGVADITLDSDFLWPKSFEIPVDQRKLIPRDEQELSDQYPDYRTRQGSVEYYYLNGLNLGLFQVPGSIRTITYSYQRRPDRLVDLTDICELPEEWHQLITQKATTQGYDYDQNSEGSVRSIAKEKVLFLQLGTNVHKRPDETLILGSPKYRGRPPRPRFPISYPPIGG